LASSTTTTIIIIIIIIPYNINRAYVKCKNESDTSNNKRKWNHLKITQTVPEQHTKKAQNKEIQKTAILGAAHILQKVLM